MIRIHLEDLSKYSYGQSYGHLKMHQAIYMLRTPQIHFRLHKDYASHPQRALKGSAARHARGFAVALGAGHFGYFGYPAAARRLCDVALDNLRPVQNRSRSG